MNSIQLVVPAFNAPITKSEWKHKVIEGSQLSVYVCKVISEFNNPDGRNGNAIQRLHHGKGVEGDEIE